MSSAAMITLLSSRSKGSSISNTAEESLREKRGPLGVDKASHASSLRCAMCFQSH